MAKSAYKFLIVVAVVCLSVFFTMFALSAVSKGNFDENGLEISAKNFPLEVDLQNYVFNMGEKISFNATITNSCGKDVTAIYRIGTPCVFFHEINDDTASHAEITTLCSEILKTNDKLLEVFEYEFVEPGTYVFYVHYNLEVDGVAISDELEFIVEVT